MHCLTHVKRGSSELKHSEYGVLHGLSLVGSDFKHKNKHTHNSTYTTHRVSITLLASFSLEQSCSYRYKKGPGHFTELCLASFITVPH